MRTAREAGRRALLGALAAFAAPWAWHASASEPERFVVCYGQDASPEEFAPYRRAVLDADHHPELGPLKARGIELFGYVSLGEADEARSHYDEVVAAGLLLGPNPNWPGAQYVDLRLPAWRALLLDRIIPDTLAQGFDGLFLDTLDDAAFLEHADPVANLGMVEAAANLVRAIHGRFPSAKLMLNRAYEVGALVATDLDSVLAESLATAYDFSTRRYHARPTSDLNWGLSRLAELRKLNRALRLYTLDYWDLSDHAGVMRLYQRERQAGFIPYVSTIDLQRIAPEPRPGARGGNIR